MVKTKRRNSKQRRIILEELRNLKTHPTADHLHRLLRERMPNISLGTVYRNLELLKTENQILKLNSLTSQSRFDGNPLPHHHIHCTGCGRVDDAEELENDEYLEEVKHLKGYEIQGYKLDFVGVCSNCRQKKQPKEWRK